jgi:uncharacterized protein YprB with RNaseH-like and TPR domain
MTRSESEDKTDAMIGNTFCIFPGIGQRTERYLWKCGVLSWPDFLGRKHIPGFSDRRKAALDVYVSRAAAAFESGNFRYFLPLLGPSGAWRLWETLSPDALCMDIETDGKSAAEGSVTVVGFYSHGEYRPYVAGKNLTPDAVQLELEGAGLLVTYSGGGFDIPYLKACYPELCFDMPHLDLCPAGHKAGLKGGLKKVEKLVGISRPDEVDGLSGYEAVLLWQAHKCGDEGALDTLVKYNREDTMNLHALARIIYGRLMYATGLPSCISCAGRTVSPEGLTELTQPQVQG